MYQTEVMYALRAKLPVEEIKHKDFLNPDEVMKLYGFGVEYLSKLLLLKKINLYGEGRKPLYKKSEIDTYIENTKRNGVFQIRK